METVPVNDVTRRYRLRVAGALDRALCDHYGGRMQAAAGDTLYEFSVPDQTSLHGVLSHCRDYGVEILSLCLVR